MSVFLSYSSRDAGVVKTLAQGLEAAKRDVWFDHELKGGEVWWSSILDNIRNCSVFIFAVSDASLESKPCQSELDYATALGRPVLPIRVGPVRSLRTSPLAERQIMDYDPGDAQSGFAVLAAVEETALRQLPLPDPLPPEPPIPYLYLLALRRRIDSKELSVEEQKDVIDELRRALGEETDESVRQDILTILEHLNGKPWTTRWTEKEVKALLHVYGPEGAGDGTAPAPAAPAAAAPGGAWRRRRASRILANGSSIGWSSCTGSGSRPRRPSILTPILSPGSRRRMPPRSGGARTRPPRRRVAAR